MTIADAQADVRETYLAGAPGQAVSGLLWLVSAACATWGSPRLGILVLCVGGAFIFPLLTLALRLMGRRATLPAGHPMNALAMQVAFTVPLAIPVVLAATGFRTHWFYPAFMVIVGAHYLPFVFLYGMREFAVLAALLVAGGVGLALYGPASFVPGGWATGIVLLLFAGWVARRREPPAPA